MTNGDAIFMEETRYFLQDHLGSTNYMFDDTGNIVSKRAEIPFGMTWKNEGVEFFYGYTGKEKDDDINLTYFGAWSKRSKRVFFCICTPKQY